MVEQVANGALDIAILYNARPPIKGLEISEIASEELLLVGTPHEAQGNQRHSLGHWPRSRTCL